MVDRAERVVEQQGRWQKRVIERLQVELTPGAQLQRQAHNRYAAQTQCKVYLKISVSIGHYVGLFVTHAPLPRQECTRKQFYEIN